MLALSRAIEQLVARCAFVTALGLMLLCSCAYSRLPITEELMTTRNIVDLGDVAISYTASIRPNDGRATIVLLHGFGASADSWHDILPGLARSRSIVALDLRGAGLSSKPHDRLYSPIEHADAVLRAIRALGLTDVVLVGHSLGGGVAIISALELLKPGSREKLSGLILVDPAIYRQRLPFFVEYLRDPVARFLVYRTSATFRARYVLDRAFFVKDQVTPERVERYARYFDLPGHKNALVQTALQLFRHDPQRWINQLGKIAVPTLILWGDKDPVIPVSFAQRLQQAIPQSRLELIPNTGHVPHEERPAETLTAIVRFLGASR